MNGSSKRLIVGISGATGAILGVRFLEFSRELGIETHLVVTRPAERTLLHEMGLSLDRVRSLATYSYDIDDIGADIASGSFPTDGMIIVPCSMKTLSAVVNSYNENLLVRAADVTLKERRRLVVVPRETPLHKGHVELMLRLCDLGGVLLPPFPAFYNHPKTIDDIVNHIVCKALFLFGYSHSSYRRWGIESKEGV